MTYFVEIPLLLTAILCLIPCVVFGVQSLTGAMMHARRNQDVATSSQIRPRIGVLIPAHNESSVLNSTLKTVQAQLTEADLLLVIADNCTDETARLAKQVGASVVERTDAQKRGKGFAVQAGLAAFAKNPPEVVIFLDADCHLEEGCLDALTWAAVEKNGPVQGAYTMLLPKDPNMADRLSAFAVVTKNVVRPAGMTVLGLPCLLTGSGFAMPWSLTTQIRFDGHDLVEDMKMSIDLAHLGKGPSFCRRAKVTAPLPHDSRAADSQRTRWEHGHLQTIQKQAPRMAMGFLRRPSLRRLGMLLDLAVPPLSLLVLGTTSLAVVLVCLVATGLAHGVSQLSLFLAIIALLSVAAGCVAAWLCVGRQFISGTDLACGLPSYLLGKLPRFARYIWSPERQWIRTAR